MYMYVMFFFFYLLPMPIIVLLSQYCYISLLYILRVFMLFISIDYHINYDYQLSISNYDTHEEYKVFQYI